MSAKSASFRVYAPSAFVDKPGSTNVRLKVAIVRHARFGGKVDRKKLLALDKKPKPKQPATRKRKKSGVTAPPRSTKRRKQGQDGLVPPGPNSAPQPDKAISRFLGEVQELQKQGFFCIPRVKHPPTSPMDIISLLHPLLEALFLTLAIPYTYPAKTQIQFKVESNPNSQFAAMWTATKLQELQKKLAKSCGDQQSPPPLNQLGKLWIAILKPQASSPSGIMDPNASVARLCQAFLTSRLQARLIDTKTVEVWVTGLKGDPLSTHVDFKQPNLDPGCRVVWSVRGDAGDHEFPEHIQVALNHVLILVRSVYPTPASSDDDVVVRYAGKFTDTAPVFSYSLQLSLLVQRNTVRGTVRRVFCKLRLADGSMEAFLEPTRTPCTYQPLAFRETESKRFNLLRWDTPRMDTCPGWMTKEEYESPTRGLVKRIQPDDERYELFTAGLPLGWKVKEVHLISQPKERKLFAMALDVEEVKDLENEVLLCWHGAPEDAAKGIAANGPNTSLSKLNSKVAAFGPGMYFATDSLVSLHNSYSPPDKQNCKYLLKCAVIASKPHVNASAEAQVIPGEKNCFVDRVPSPRVIVHQRPSYILILAMLVVEKQ